MEKLPAMQVLPKQDCDESSARKTNVGRVLAVVSLWASVADIILREHGSIIARDCATEREGKCACGPGGDVTTHEYGLWSRYDDKDNRNPGLGHLHALKREAEA